MTLNILSSLKTTNTLTSADGFMEWKIAGIEDMIIKVSNRFQLLFQNALNPAVFTL